MHSFNSINLQLLARRNQTIQHYRHNDCPIADLPQARPLNLKYRLAGFIALGLMIAFFILTN
jgi:hypothetical protein